MFEEFYENWINKANGYSENVLGDIFDKYITLFIIYNCEYRLIEARLREKQGIPRNNGYSDRFAATVCIVKYIGANNFMNWINEHGLKIETERIIELIETQRFYINLNLGMRQRSKDLTILDKLKSNDPYLNATAILEVIYFVRCNLIHGHKLYAEYQQELLLPLIRILNELIVLCRVRILNET